MASNVLTLAAIRGLTLLAVLGVVACASAPAPSTTVGSDNSTAAAEQQRIDQDLDNRLAALERRIKSPSFGKLSGDSQYKLLSNAYELAIARGQQALGYQYLVRAVAMPQADFEAWRSRLQLAAHLGYQADAVSSLTVVAHRWPAQTLKFDSKAVVAVVMDAERLPHRESLALLQALYAAHWRPKSGLEPSWAWRDLTLLLLERGRTAEAIDVSTHVIHPYILIAMRADPRFDAVIAAHPEQFEIDARSDRMLSALQTASDTAPRSLELKRAELAYLLSHQHYSAMLAVADDTILEIRSTNYPRRLYEDYDALYSWLLDDRSTALERLGRWDEALEQLTEASKGADVSQLINLAALYCSLSRPNDALTAIGRASGVNAYGAVIAEEVRLDAAVQLGDLPQVSRSLEYLRAHRKDFPMTYVEALIVAGELDRAAKLLAEQLLNSDQRQDALLRVQNFAPEALTKWDTEQDTRWHEVLARKEVQRAIHKVGRVENYPLEAPW